MGALLSLIPIQFRAGAAAGGVLLALAGFGGAYAWIDHRGYERATQEWTVKYQQREDELNRQRLAELDRQATANAAAKAEEEAELEAYRKQVIAMADRNAQLANEAAADPNHDNIALDADAVTRHNRRID